MSERPGVWVRRQISWRWHHMRTAVGDWLADLSRRAYPPLPDPVPEWMQWLPDAPADDDLEGNDGADN